MPVPVTPLRQLAALERQKPREAPDLPSTPLVRPKAVEQLDLVIQIIRQAANADAARDALMSRLDLTEVQPAHKGVARDRERARLEPQHPSPPDEVFRLEKKKKKNRPAGEVKDNGL